MRYYVKASGSETFPDIDGEFDEVPSDLTSKYPFVNIACLTPISREAITAALRTRHNSIPV